MGDPFSEGKDWELPRHTVNVSALYMDRYEVSKGFWDMITAWGNANGYSDLVVGGGKAPDHPVVVVTWCDCVKWCNARSEKEGLTPVYYTDAGASNVYRTGDIEPHADWLAGGYRLPTEAEWERAARGGAVGKRFAWSDADTIDHTRACYRSTSVYPDYVKPSYDINPYDGQHPDYYTGEMPYTAPVNSFVPNGYGLHNMIGNVTEWCWDWLAGSYSSGTVTDPRGPSSGTHRVVRNGAFDGPATSQRVSSKAGGYPTTAHTANMGFRTVSLTAP